MRSSLCLLVLFAFGSSALGGDRPSLEGRLAPLAKAHKGKVAIAVKNLGTGESFFLNADEPMPTASLIKLAVMFEAYQQAKEDNLKLTDTVTLRQADKVPGSGILTAHFSDGATFSLRDAVRLMIAFSDNTATNLVLDKVGIAAVNRRMKAWGYAHTKIYAQVFKSSTTSIDPEASKRFGLGSTTAREMIGLLEDLETGKHFPPAVKQVILGHLKKCEDKVKFPRFLPEGTILAHKTGSVNKVRTDAGLLYLEDAIALCVLTAENEDESWKADNAGNVLCARVGKEVYEHFSAKKGNSAPNPKE